MITIDPKLPPRPTIPAGKYGADGEVELRKFRQATVRFGKNAGEPCINMQVSINTAEHGVVHLFKDWALEGKAKVFTLRMLKNLGIDTTPGDDGTFTFDGTALEGEKVIVKVGLDEWPAGTNRQGKPYEAGSRNTVEEVWKRT
jgi:hypothetical protein